MARYVNSLDYTISIEEPLGTPKNALWLSSVYVMDDDEVQADDPYCVQLRAQLEREALRAN